jgi:putative transposase
MIDREHALPISRQAQALGISRGSVYYLPAPTRAADLALMRRIDELHLEHPHACHRPPQWSHSRIGAMEPVDDRRNGAT